MRLNGPVSVSSGFRGAPCMFTLIFIYISGSNKDYSEQKLYLSTHTSEGEQNYLMQATVQMPLPDTVIDMRKYDSDGNSMFSKLGMDL